MGAASSFVLDEVDSALVELAVESLGLELAELVRLDQLRQLGCTNGTSLFRGLDDLPDVLRSQDVLDLDGHATRFSNTWAMVRSNTIASARARLSCPSRRTITVLCQVETNRHDASSPSPGFSTERPCALWKC